MVHSLGSVVCSNGVVFTNINDIIMSKPASLYVSMAFFWKLVAVLQWNLSITVTLGQG